MKSRIKQWKRNWRKLGEFDESAFLVRFIMCLCGIVLWIARPTDSFGFVFACWALTGVSDRVYCIIRARQKSYQYYKKGRMKQEQIDWFANTQTRFENAELGFKLKQLHSDYKKLEYDYNQLKKSINTKKKKK